MKITFIGTGTSTGVPMIGCTCEVCRSESAKDKRLRTSLWAEISDVHLLIDTGIDLRQQLLRYRIPTVDAVLFTHHHVDHIFGLDDLRPINFLQNKTIDIYASESTTHHLQRIYPYVFNGHHCPSDIPKIESHIFHLTPFEVRDVSITPIPLLHGRLPIFGFRIGNFAYCTDVSHIPDTSYDLLNGLEVLILGALRDRPHPTHFTIDDAVREALKIKAKKTYLIHMSHEVGHKSLLKRLPPGIEPAFDGLKLELGGDL